MQQSSRVILLLILKVWVRPDLFCFKEDVMAKKVAAPKRRRSTRADISLMGQKAIKMLSIHRFNETFGVCSTRYLTPVSIKQKDVAEMILEVFQDYTIEIDLAQERPIIEIQEFPHHLITDLYTGKSVLQATDISELLNEIKNTSNILEDMGHENPLEAACSCKGITLRAFVDMELLIKMRQQLRYNESMNVRLPITKAPIIPNSVAKIKLGIKSMSGDEYFWQYTARLIGEYTQEEKAMAAQELFRENATFDRDTGAFLFDHYPKTLKVEGENNQ